MNNKTELETLLQNTVDELFALHAQAKEDQQKFLMANAALIKASYQQVTDSTNAAIRAEHAAIESREAAKQTGSMAYNARHHVQFWQRAVFWFAVGYLIMGAAFGWIYFKLGREITSRNYELAVLQMRYDALIAAIKDPVKPKTLRE